MSLHAGRCGCRILLASVLLAGCKSYVPGWWTLRSGLTSAENALADSMGLEDAAAVEFSWDMGWTLSAGAMFPHDGRTARCFTLGLDLGLLTGTALHVERQWLVAYIYTGKWRWKDACATRLKT